MPVDLASMRTLIVVPIVHTTQDLVSFQERVQAAHKRIYGEKAWAAHVQSVDDLWAAIRAQIFSYQLNYAKLRIYQDGLPLCAHEMQIVRDVAAQGSKNHQLILELVAKGARLMGTEDAQLLLMEYHLQQCAFAPSEVQTMEETERRREQSRQLLVDRDKFMARQISLTLEGGETGLFFIGMLHEVEKYLPQDVLVRHMLPSSSRRGDR